MNRPLRNRHSQECIECDDAVLLAALNAYYNDRHDHGEAVSERAALKIVEIAQAIGLRVSDDAYQGGFFVYNGALRTVLREAVAAAQQLVEHCDTRNKVGTLLGICCGRSVAEIEAIDAEPGFSVDDLRLAPVRDQKDMKTALFRTVHLLCRLYWRLTKPTTRGVRALVVGEDGKVLLVHHTYTSGWYLPGGGVRRNESPEAALRRELREEVGIEQMHKLEKFGEYINRYEFKTDFITVFVIDSFSASSNSHFEISKQEYFNPRELPEGTSPGTRRRIGEWLGERDQNGQW